MLDIASLISTMYQAEHDAVMAYRWPIEDARDKSRSWFIWRRRAGTAELLALEAERRALLFRAAIAAFLLNNAVARQNRAEFYAAMRGGAPHSA